MAARRRAASTSDVDAGGRGAEHRFESPAERRRSGACEGTRQDARLWHVSLAHHVGDPAGEGRTRSTIASFSMDIAMIRKRPLTLERVSGQWLQPDGEVRDKFPRFEEADGGRIVSGK